MTYRREVASVLELGGFIVKLNRHAWHRVTKVAMGASVAVLLFSATGTSAAFADDGDPTGDSTTVHTDPQADPAETDLVELTPSQVDADPDIPGANSDGTGAGMNHPGSELCDDINVYTPINKGGYHVKGVGATNVNSNGTNHAITSTFTAKVTGTVGIAISGDLKTTAKFLIAKIEAKYNVTLSASMTAKLDNTVQTSTPAHKSSHATYGVYRLRNQGTSYHVYSSCHTTPKKTVTSYTPHHVGWYIWETKI